MVKTHHTGHESDRYEEVEGTSNTVPFEVTHALALLGLREAWRASFVRLEGMKGKTPSFLAGLDKDSDWHKKQAKEAREAWTQISRKWADAPRGQKEGMEVTNLLIDAAKAAAEHTAAMRIPYEKEDKKPEEAYAKFEAASNALKESHVVNGVLRHKVLAVLWNAAWHVANLVGDRYDEELENEEEDEDEGDYEDEEGEDEDEDEGEDEEEEDEYVRFGADYLGSSDDTVMDMSCLMDAMGECFWEGKKFHGVRLPAAGAADHMEAIAALPGAFGEKALNAVRLVLPDLSGEKDPLGAAAKAALQKAEALDLRVVLELPAVPGKSHEKWLGALAAAAALLKCVRGVALSAVASPEGAWPLLQALRAGGLTQDRCTCFLPLEGGQATDDEGEWLDPYASVMRSELGTGKACLLFADGNTWPEAPAAFPEAKAGGPATSRELLDYASKLNWDLTQYVGLVSTWSLEVPPEVQKHAAKAKGAALTDLFYKEFAERMRGTVEEAVRGWFFEAWSGGEADASLQACLESGRLDLGLEVCTLQPAGDKHLYSVVYLSGFCCDGYSYLMEPEHFYRAKPKKKSAKDKLKKKKGDDDDEEQEYEPIPGLKVILPSPPPRKITAFHGEEHAAWYDYYTDYDGDQEDDFCMEDLDAQTRRIHEILDAEAAIVGGKNVFIGGASQGCGVALHIGLTYDGELGGIVGTMGHLLTRTPVRPEWVENKVPIFVYNGLADSMMKWDEWVAATWKRLEDAGADIRISTSEGVDHGENEDVWLRSFLNEALRPSTVKALTTKKVTGKKK